MTLRDLSQFWVYPGIRIVIFFFLAWLVSLLARFFAHRMMFVFGLPKRSANTQPERFKTLESLGTSAIRLLAFVAAVLASIAQYVELSTVIWVVGLFSAAFGLAARPVISDVMTGIGFIFEDTFAVGEKVMLYTPFEIEGVIEAINLRSTWLRSPSGEFYTIPNGEIRVVRNFSRGSFSDATITFNIQATDLERTLDLLESLGREASNDIPDLLETWQVISKTGKIGQQTELSLIARTSFGKAGELRPRLLALVHERLKENGIALVN